MNYSPATPKFVRDRTGSSIGGEPLVGHSYPLETWMDASLFQFRRIWAAAGTPNRVFQVTPDDLKRIKNAAVVQLG